MKENPVGFYPLPVGIACNWRRFPLEAPWVRWVEAISGGTTGVVLDISTYVIHVFFICNYNDIFSLIAVSIRQKCQSIHSFLESIHTLDIYCFRTEVAIRTESICIDSGKLCRTPQEIGTLQKPWLLATFYLKSIEFGLASALILWFWTSPSDSWWPLGLSFVPNWHPKIAFLSVQNMIEETFFRI